MLMVAGWIFLFAAAYKLFTHRNTRDLWVALVLALFSVSMLFYNFN